MKYFNAIRIGFLCLPLLAFSLVSAQVIEISQGQKTIVKYDDYEVLGRNSIGTIVHYFSSGDNHKLEIFNNKMRVFNEIELELGEKKSAVEKVLLAPDHILVFYSVIDNGYEYLKLKKINYRLDIHREGVMIDSIKRSAVNTYQGYFIKPSDDEKHFVAFTFEEKGRRIEVRYVLMDKFQQVLRTGVFWTEDKSNKTVESVKVNNNGDLLVVIGHLDRRLSDDEDFSFDKFTVHLLPHDQNEPLVTEIVDEDYLFKDLLTNWDEDRRTAIVVGTYQARRESEDIGVFYETFTDHGIGLPYTKQAFTEEDFEGSNAPFRRWNDNAGIQRPKRIIPRSDGGFIFITEAERHDYRLISAVPGATPGYPYYPDYSNYFDENYFYDLLIVSVDPDGGIDWRINAPKIQETENDRGRYSSFMYCGNNNVVKLFFVDDIYGNGNLNEVDFNPNGTWNKRTLLNSYREELLLVPLKGVQLSGTEVIIPSEKKNRLRLVKISY